MRRTPSTNAMRAHPSSWPSSGAQSTPSTPSSTVPSAGASSAASSGAPYSGDQPSTKMRAIPAGYYVRPPTPLEGERSGFRRPDRRCLPRSAVVHEHGRPDLAWAAVRIAGAVHRFPYHEAGRLCIGVDRAIAAGRPVDERAGREGDDRAGSARPCPPRGEGGDPVARSTTELVPHAPEPPVSAKITASSDPSPVTSAICAVRLCTGARPVGYARPHTGRQGAPPSSKRRQAVIPRSVRNGSPPGVSHATTIASPADVAACQDTVTCALRGTSAAAGTSPGPTASPNESGDPSGRSVGYGEEAAAEGMAAEGM